jgi:hypothetical protein
MYLLIADQNHKLQQVEVAWYSGVIGVVMSRIAEQVQHAQLMQQRRGMAAADRDSAFYRYYRKLQPCLQVCTYTIGTSDSMLDLCFWLVGQ